ncbi:MAG: CvpA family protein [Tannerella sp.]|jgi:membrane protein required for colicin V production|nr:CvpA family protein [Tannerella sp.]
MNWLDIAILILAGIGLIKGIVDGMIKQVVSLGAFIIGIYFSTWAAEKLSVYLAKLTWIPPEANVIVSYVLGFLLIVCLVMLAGMIVNRLVSVTPLSFINHLIGGAIGLLITILFISLVFNMIEIFDKKSKVLPQETKVESRYYDKVRKMIPAVFPGDIFQTIQEAVKKKIE